MDMRGAMIMQRPTADILSHLGNGRSGEGERFAATDSCERPAIMRGASHMRQDMVMSDASLCTHAPKPEIIAPEGGCTEV